MAGTFADGYDDTGGYPPQDLSGPGAPVDMDIQQGNDNMLLDPPDPVDLLMAHTEEGLVNKARPLDFVRAKFHEIKKENKMLRERVADLEQTLSIVQTAQEWTMGKGMTQEQKEKMKEIRGLLEQAKKAKEDLNNFSGASRQALYEKLRACKAALRREREEKREMKDRLLHAFDHARAIKEQHKRMSQQRLDEQERWQEIIRDMKDQHHRELRRLQGDEAVETSQRQDQLSHFGEQVMDGLTALQQHLHDVRQETVDTVILEGDDPGDELLAGDDYAGASPGDADDF